MAMLLFTHRVQQRNCCFPDLITSYLQTFLLSYMQIDIAESQLLLSLVFSDLACKLRYFRRISFFFCACCCLLFVFHFAGRLNFNVKNLLIKFSTTSAHHPAMKHAQNTNWTAIKKIDGFFHVVLFMVGVSLGTHVRIYQQTSISCPSILSQSYRHSKMLP